MLPIGTGILPFGLVMGSVAAAANLDIWQTMGMNVLVFAGASQLAAVDLMSQNASAIVVVATGAIINLRFILYSASLSTIVKNESLKIKALSAYILTDQTYTVLAANQKKLNTIKENMYFYFGAAFIMISIWQSSVLLGFIFGNFAPAKMSLDFAVPLSFVALVIPTLINYKYILVACIASILSLVLYDLPYNLGLLVSAFVAILLGAQMTKSRRGKNDK